MNGGECGRREGGWVFWWLGGQGDRLGLSVWVKQGRRRG